MKAKYISAVFLSPLILLSSGCGPGSMATMPIPPVAIPACAPASPAAIAYALNGDLVSMCTANSCTGALTPTTPATVPTDSTQQEPHPESMVADPGGRFAYVANLVSNAMDSATISMYTIDSSTGVLTPTTPATVSTGFLPQGIAIDPAGKFIYTANSDDNTVSMFTINPITGILTPATPASVAAGAGPLSATVDPSGRFAYVSNQGDDTISMYTINSISGVLTPMTPATVRTGFSPFAVTVDPSGKFAYVPNAYDPGNTVSQYSIDPVTGILTPSSPSTATAGNQPTSVTVDPSSKFAYVTNRTDNTVSIFTVDPRTGTLSPMGAVTTGTEPFHMVIDASGKFAYVVNEGSALTIYAVENDGALTPAGSAGTATSGSVSMTFIAPKQ